MFEHLDVPTKASNMSFAVSVGNGRLEYSGNGVSGLFAQRRNMARPHYWRMVWDLVRFYREAAQIVEDGNLEAISLGELLDRHYDPMYARSIRTNFPAIDRAIVVAPGGTDEASFREAARALIAASEASP